MAEAVRLCQGRSVLEVAKSLGIHDTTLYKWEKKANKEADSANGTNSRRELEEELKRLRKENADLREETEILKKASAYFAKHQR